MSTRLGTSTQFWSSVSAVAVRLDPDDFRHISPRAALVSGETRVSAEIHQVTLRSARCKGRVNWTVAPCGSWGAAQIRPPCNSMIERQIDSPIPMPPDLVVKKVL